MKLSNPKLLEIVQAAIGGKTIQIAVTVKGGKEWRDIDHLVAGCGEEAYRIKPEPPLIKGAAYLCWNNGGPKWIRFYVGDYCGKPRFNGLLDEDASYCVTWDNWELFVQPEEALRGEEA